MALRSLGFLVIAVVSLGLLYLIGILALPGAVLLSAVWTMAVNLAFRPGSARMPQPDGQPTQPGAGDAQAASSAEWHRRRSRLLVQLGLLTALLGFGLVVYLAFGPTYGYCEAIMEVTADGSSAMRDATGSCGYRSMLEVQGVPPVVWAAGVAYLLVGLGALAEAGRTAGRRIPPGAGRWLSLAATAPMVVLGMLSWGLAPVLPATILAVVATSAAFSAPASTGQTPDL